MPRKAKAKSATKAPAKKRAAKAKAETKPAVKPKEKVEPKAKAKAVEPETAEVLEDVAGDAPESAEVDPPVEAAPKSNGVIEPTASARRPKVGEVVVYRDKFSSDPHQARVSLLYPEEEGIVNLQIFHAHGGRTKPRERVPFGVTGGCWSYQ